jgi:hypothetical protein
MKRKAGWCNRAHNILGFRTSTLAPLHWHGDPALKPKPPTVGPKGGAGA